MSLAQQQPKAAARSPGRPRPTGLHLSNSNICTDSCYLQHQAASNSQVCSCVVPGASSRHKSNT